MAFVALILCASFAIPCSAIAQSFAPRDLPPDVRQDLATVPAEKRRRRANPAPQKLRIEGVPEPASDTEASFLYRRHRKIVGLALALELIVPSAGLIYTRRYPEAVFYWAGFATSMLLIFSGIGDGKNDPHVPRLVAGASALVVFRVGAMVWAPVAAHRHNETLAAQLGVDRWGRPLGKKRRTTPQYRPRLAPRSSLPPSSDLPPMAQPQSSGFLLPVMRIEF